MKLKLTWSQGAQWAVVLLCVLALKLYYAQASADQLRWVLAPTTLLVEAVSGTSFEFEPHAGYLSEDRRFLIAPACAGINFLIAAFLMLAARRLWRVRAQGNGWAFIPAAALIAYVTTLIANATRITIALRLAQRQPVAGLSPEALHRAEGIIVYFGFLLLVFVIGEKMSAEKSRGLWRQSLLPLAVYYATALGMPLANGAYRQGADFWEHAAFVLLIPVLLILPFALARRLRMGVMPARSFRGGQ